MSHPSQIKIVPDTDGYCRVSTQKQVTQGHGLERYIEDLELCGVHRDRIFWDVESGDSDDREGYNQVLERVRQGITKKVLIPCFDRFTRSPLHWESAIVDFNTAGAVLETTSGIPIDLTTPEGIYKSRLDAAAAAFWREKSAYAASRGWERRRDKLKANVPPFGYLTKNDRYVVNREPYAPMPDRTNYDVARELIETFLTDGTCRNTCRIMIQRYGKERYGTHPHEDFPRDRGKLKAWLENPTLRGYTRYFGNRGKEQIVIPEPTHKAIISTDEARAIDAILAAKSRRFSPSSQVMYPLSGLIYCACGSKTIVNGRTPRHYYCGDIYEVTGSRTCELRGGLKTMIAEQVVIDAICTRASKEIANRASRSQAPRNRIETPEIETIRRKLRKLGDDPDFEEFRRSLQLKLEALEREALSKVLDLSQRRNDLIAAGSNPEFYRSLPVPKRRFIYTQLIDRVIKSGRRIVEIQFLGDLGTVRFDDREQT